MDFSKMVEEHLERGADVTVAGDLRVNGTEVLGPVDNHLQLRSDTSMYFDIDRDDDGTD